MKGIDSHKIRIIYIFYFSFAILLVIFSIRWQIVRSAEFREIAQSRIVSSEINSQRGTIYAADGTTLAFSEPRFDAYIWVKGIETLEDWNIQTREEFLNKVAPIIDKTPSELETLIRVNQENTTDSPDWIKVDYFVIAESITPEQREALLDIRTDKDENIFVRGLEFEQTSKRIYPEDRLASHILGLTTVNKDKVVGTDGLEGQWNGILNPTKGIEIKESDAVGQAVASSLTQTIEPKPGSSIYITIDKKLQKIVEEQAKVAVERYEAEAGTIVVMDPKTGEIMALANFPDYNPNTRDEDNIEVFTNRALSKPYEIGSIGKVFTLAAVIEEGMVEKDDLIVPNGHDGCVFLTDDLGDLCTWDKKPQGPLKADECLIKSDNVCFFELSKMLEEDTFFSYLNRFGAGQKTGIDIIGESNGFIKDPASDELGWNIADVAAYSYGHGYSMNVMQAISGISAIPNNGIRMQPRFVSRIERPDGEIERFDPVALNNGERILSERTSRVMGEIMHDAYLSNIPDWEGWYHDLRNYNIGMKSGTALIATPFGYSDDVNVTHVGFDMSEERSFVMLVNLEKPKDKQLSYYNSRIMWLDTFAAIKDHINVPRK